jgi:hypothetical protein
MQTLVICQGYYTQVETLVNRKVLGNHFAVTIELSV